MVGLLLPGERKPKGGSWASPATSSDGSLSKKALKEKVRCWYSSSAFQFPKRFPEHFLLLVPSQPQKIGRQEQFPKVQRPGGSKPFLFPLRTITIDISIYLIVLFKLMNKKSVLLISCTRRGSCGKGSLPNLQAV